MSNKITVYEFDTTSRMHPFLAAVQIDENIGLKDNQTTVAPNEAQFFNGHEWVNELTNAYHYDEKGYFDAVAIIPKGSELKTNETLVVPYDSEGRGMYKPKFDTTQNVWVETLTQEEIDALNKPATPEPDAQDQLNKQLMVRIAGLQTSVATQSKLNANLIKDLTEIKKKLATDTTTTNA